MSVLLCPAPPAPGACTFFVSLLWKPLRDFTSCEVQISDYDTAILQQPVMSQNALSLVNSSRKRTMQMNIVVMLKAISRHPASRTLARPNDRRTMCTRSVALKCGWVFTGFQSRLPWTSFARWRDPFHRNFRHAWFFVLQSVVATFLMLS